MKHTGLEVHIGDVVGLLSAPSSFVSSASPLGDVVGGYASPPENTVGSPSVRDVASPGSPHGSPAENVAVRPGPPECIPRGGSPPACIAAPPGPPPGSPAGVCAACSAAPPGPPYGSPAGASVAEPGMLSVAPIRHAPTPPHIFFDPEPVDNGVALGDDLGPLHLAKMLAVEGGLAVGELEPGVWPCPPMSISVTGAYPASSTSAPVVQIMAGGLGPSYGPAAASTSTDASVDSDDSSPRSVDSDDCSRRSRRRHRRAARERESLAGHPATFSSSSCTPRGGGWSTDDPPTESDNVDAPVQVTDRKIGSTLTSRPPPTWSSLPAWQRSPWGGRSQVSGLALRCRSP